MRAALHAPCPVLIVKQPPRTVQRILLAVDGSPSSRKGLDFVLAHFAPAHRRGQRGNRSLEIIVAHVLPKEQARLKCTVTHVQESAEALREGGFAVVEQVQMGKPAPTLLTMATKHRADLIVMGAKGLGAIARFFLGSVSYEVLQHARCSVLIVKE
jgi:nucleotide-binding universal stress UspA family protein